MEIWKVDYFIRQDCSIGQAYFMSKKDAHNFSKCKGETASHPVTVNVKLGNESYPLKEELSEKTKQVKDLVMIHFDKLIEHLKGE